MSRTFYILMESFSKAGLPFGPEYGKVRIEQKRPHIISLVWCESFYRAAEKALL